jgi:hypothetical protein
MAAVIAADRRGHHRRTSLPSRLIAGGSRLMAAAITGVHRCHHG